MRIDDARESVMLKLIDIQLNKSDSEEEAILLIDGIYITISISDLMIYIRECGEMIEHAYDSGVTSEMLRERFDPHMDEDLSNAIMLAMYEEMVYGKLFKNPKLRNNIARIGHMNNYDILDHVEWAVMVIPVLYSVFVQVLVRRTSEEADFVEDVFVLICKYLRTAYHNCRIIGIEKEKISEMD